MTLKERFEAQFGAMLVQILEQQTELEALRAENAKLKADAEKTEK